MSMLCVRHVTRLVTVGHLTTVTTGAVFIIAQRQLPAPATEISRRDIALGDGARRIRRRFFANTRGTSKGQWLCRHCLARKFQATPGAGIHDTKDTFARIEQDDH